MQPESGAESTNSSARNPELIKSSPDNDPRALVGEDERAIVASVQMLSPRSNEDDAKFSIRRSSSDSAMVQPKYSQQDANVNIVTPLGAQETSPQPDSYDNDVDSLNSPEMTLMGLPQDLKAFSEFDDAIVHWNQILGTTKEVTRQLIILSHLSVLHMQRFEEMGDLSDVNQSIRLCTNALSLSPEGHAHRPRLLINLGNSYKARYRRLKTLEDIDHAINYQNEAVSIAIENHSDEIAGMCDLGSSLQARFEHVGDVKDLQQGISYQVQALSLLPDSHANKRRWLSNLGRSLRLLFELSGRADHIDRAIAYQNEALSLLDLNHKRTPYLMSSLGISHHRRFERLGNHDDLDQAIYFHNQALSHTPDGHPDRLAWLNNLGAAHQSRFELLGDIVDINQGIVCLSQALSLAPSCHPFRSSLITNLGNSYLRRFLCSDDTTDINQAISYHTQAVSLTPEGDADRPGNLSHLGNSYWGRFQRLGDLDDINQAINFQTQAVATVPENHIDKPKWLSNLGVSLRYRFQRLGNVSDIDGAIAHQSQALSLVPEDHPGRSGWVGNLGVSYQTRFTSLGDISDIDQAVVLHTRAVSLSLEGGIDKAKWLESLGLSLLYRFDRLGNVADIDQAIFDQTHKLLVGDEIHLDMPKSLNNLGLSHHVRYSHLGDAADINQAIDYQTQALSVAPNNHVDRPGWLYNLGSSYQLRFDRLGNTSDIDHAISYHSQAVALTPEGHLQRPAQLKSLGFSYYSRFRSLKEQSDYDSSIQAFQESANSFVGPASIRFQSASNWARMSTRKDLPSSLKAYQRAMELLPLVVWLGNTLQRRYQDIPLLEGVVNEAVTAAAMGGNYDNAVEWLEEGHSIVWRQVLNLRTSFDDLRVASPELAGRLERVARELDHAGQPQTHTSRADSMPYHSEQEAQRHRALAQDWEALVEEARNIPGFSSLLRPKSIAQLVESARSGPVVVLNIHKTQCDAFVLLPGRQNATRVPLPELSHDKAAHAYKQLMHTLHASNVRGVQSRSIIGRISAKDIFKKVLRFLWSDIVKPVLDHLQYVPQHNVDDLPCITWCTTGLLSFLPLHAAGLYVEGEPDSHVFRYAISSYAPTLSALLGPPQVSGKFMGLLAVGQFDTPGQSVLHGTEKELEQISYQFRDLPLTKLNGKNATTAAVLAGMDKHSWVHLACHASQHSNTPSMSAFYLYDGPLNLSTIINKQLKQASFAFLSACQTASGDEALPDEAVHLAAGMLVAGYKSVIATMWSIQDNEAPLVSEKVYNHMLQGGMADSRRAAKALHIAMQCLRDKVGEERFEVWVPYVHIGL